MFAALLKIITTLFLQHEVQQDVFPNLEVPAEKLQEIGGRGDKKAPGLDRIQNWALKLAAKEKSE